MTPFAWIHIAGGLVALAAGPVALIVAKGGRVHRRAGAVFAVAMLVMTGEAAVAAIAAGQTVNPLAAAFTFYLVATGWAAVKRPVPGSLERAATIAAAGVAVAGLTLGLLAQRPAGLPDQTVEGSAIYFAFAALAVLGVTLDVNAFRRQPLARPQRLARHLWRMCTALAIAAGSFFMGQQDELPAAWQGSALLPLPMLATLAAMSFWLLHTRFGWRRRRAVPALAL
jgi:uncharacterized membrane protein